MHAGIPPPLKNAPPEACMHPPGKHTPPRKHTHPLRSTHTHPGSMPPGKHTPPEAHTPPPGSRLQHTVNEQPVRILLECILVYMGKYILKGEPSYVGIFPVCLGMPLIFTDFQHCTWLRFTSHWKICEY